MLEYANPQASGTEAPNKLIPERLSLGQWRGISQSRPTTLKQGQAISKGTSEGCPPPCGPLVINSMLPPLCYLRQSADTYAIISTYFVTFCSVLYIANIIKRNTHTFTLMMLFLCLKSIVPRMNNLNMVYKMAWPNPRVPLNPSWHHTIYPCSFPASNTRLTQFPKTSSAIRHLPTSGPLHRLSLFLKYSCLTNHLVKA